MLAEPNTAFEDEKAIDEKVINEKATNQEGYFTAINILKSLAVIALLIVFHRVIYEIVCLIVSIKFKLLPSLYIEQNHL